MHVLEGLQPEEVSGFFEELKAVPSSLDDEARISEFLAGFADKRNLDVYRERALNVIIRNPETSGYQRSSAVIIRGHIKMTGKGSRNRQYELVDDTNTSNRRRLDDQPLPDMATGELELAGPAGETTTAENISQSLPDLKMKTIGVSVGPRGRYYATDVIKHRSNTVKLLGRVLTRLNQELEIRLVPAPASVKRSDTYAIISLSEAQYPRALQILQLMEETFMSECKVDIADLFYGREAQPEVLPTGLGGSFFQGGFPEAGLISFGPNQYDLHTANEHTEISSFDRTWRLLRALLYSLKQETFFPEAIGANCREKRLLPQDN